MKPEAANYLLKSLGEARWATAARTFGNAHATLIGLIVDWWTSGEPESRWALDGGPSFGHRQRSVGGGGQCDAILGEHRDAVGVVEVEGTRISETILKIGRFFAAEFTALESLQFAVVLLYAYEPRGHGLGRDFAPVVTPEVKAVLSQVSGLYPEKAVLLVSLEKDYLPQREGIRARNEYYFGSLRRVAGTLYIGGLEKDTIIYYAGFTGK